MPDTGQPDQPDPPEKWRVYEEDKSPDPEPPSEPPQVPYGPPGVPYGGTQSSYNPVFVTATSTSWSVAPKLILLVVAVAVLGSVVAGAIAILSAVDGGISGISGSSIDAKDPDDFADMVAAVEEETGGTEVFWVGLYTDYVVVDVPYTDDPGETREINYRWDGGDLDDDYSKGTSTDQLFDLSEIDPGAIDGLCDPVLELAEGATLDDCYVFIAKPGEGDKTWMRAGASDEFGQYYSVEYDKSGVELSRTCPNGLECPKR